MVPRKLNKLDIEKVIDHLVSLQGEERRLRFGGVVTDDYIKSYVEKSFEDDVSQWFGCDSHNEVVAACHVAIYNSDAELGCSVSKEFRGQGLAQQMFDRAIVYLRAKGITDVYMHCLSENQVMKHIATKNDMAVVSCCGETDAHVEVAPATPITYYRDSVLDRIAIYDMLIRSNAEAYTTFMESFRYGKRTNITRTGS